MMHQSGQEGAWVKSDALQCITVGGRREWRIQSSRKSDASLTA